MIRRLVLVLAALTAVSVTAGAAAVLPIGDSAPLQVIETDTAPRSSTTTTTTTNPGPSDPSGPGHKVWVCVVLVTGNGWTLKPGANPIEVATASRVARDAEDPEHPSYLAAGGDEPCALPEPPVSLR